jgi:hypothetical protein
LSSVANHVNKQCVSCSKVELMMTQVGAIYLCPVCFKEIFKTDDPVNLEKDTYLKLLNQQTEQCSKPYKAPLNT